MLRLYIIYAELGKRKVGVETTINPLRYGSMAYKLNHACNAKMDARDIIIARWGYKALNVIEVRPDDPAAANFEVHEELLWRYGALCDEQNEEWVCCCGAANCSRLMVRWRGRPVGEQPRIMDAEGREISQVEWPEWLRSLHASGN